SSEREAVRILGSGHSNHLLLPEALHARLPGLFSLCGKKIIQPRISEYRAIAPLVFGQVLPYQSVSGALIALVSAMVRERLKNDPDRLHETAERARYCRLLALRLQGTPLQVDRAILAGWLFEQELFGAWTQLLAPGYRLEAIIDGATGERDQANLESTILHLVIHLLSFKKHHADRLGDIERIRSYLQQTGGTATSLPAIETLLALLKDEAFISGIDRPAAHVLIVDADQTRDGALPLRLQNDGLMIDIVGTAHEALNSINHERVDCIISETTLADADGIHLCKTIKSSPVHGGIPYLFVATSSDPRVMAECLRAGADDFLPKPVDPEILSLKLHRLLSKKLGRDSRAGIKGNLSQMGFTDLIQILSSSGKSVRIALDEGSIGGELYLNQGEFVHAVCGNATGEAAFFRLMRLTKGTFEVYPCSSFPKRSISLSVLALLLEGARLDDEAARDASAAPAMP
ncbi:MAG: response regulator, partial [Chitinispirillaceae bacterium]|nr:response regulator [Chitinispirillaceae bacterium]